LLVLNKGGIVYLIPACLLACCRVLIALVCKFRGRWALLVLVSERIFWRVGRPHRPVNYRFMKSQNLRRMKFT